MTAKNKNILILTYWSYNDALVQTYTLPYIRLIRKIIPPKNKLYIVTFDIINYRVKREEDKKIKQKLLDEGIKWIRFNYFPLSIKAVLFTLFSVIKLFLICIFKKINFIHAWCSPAGILGYVLSKTTGAELIIDSFEPHAEAMVENGTWNKNSLAYKLLFRFEKKMSHHASFLIAASNGMEKYAEEKYNLKNKKIYVKPACVDFKKFSSKFKDEKLFKELELENKIVCVYAGKFGGIYLEKEIFDFLKTAAAYWKDKFAILLLTDSKRKLIEELSQRAGLNPDIIISRFVAHRDIPQYLKLANFAINPVKPVPTKRYCTSIKDGEYWAMGLPVVITKDISNDSEIIKENKIGAVIESLDKIGYENAVKEIDFLLKNFPKKELVNKIRSIAKRYRNFEIADNIYKKIYS